MAGEAARWRWHSVPQLRCRPRLDCQVSPAAVIGGLFVLIGMAVAVPEIFTPRPVPGVVTCGLVLAIFGGLLIADYLDPKGGRDRGRE